MVMIICIIAVRRVHRLLILQEMYRVYEFLQVLNGKVAIITSLVFFLFVQGTVTGELYKQLNNILVCFKVYRE